MMLRNPIRPADTEIRAILDNQAAVAENKRAGSLCEGKAAAASRGDTGITTD